MMTSEEDAWVGVLAELVNSSDQKLRLHVTLISVGVEQVPRGRQVERTLAGRSAA